MRVCVRVYIDTSITIYTELTVDCSAECGMYGALAKRDPLAEVNLSHRHRKLSSQS